MRNPSRRHLTARKYKGRCEHCGIICDNPDQYIEPENMAQNYNSPYLCRDGMIKKHGYSHEKTIIDNSEQRKKENALVVDMKKRLKHCRKEYVKAKDSYSINYWREKIEVYELELGFWA